MCHFVSLVVGGLSPEVVSSVLRSHGRHPSESPSKSIARGMAEGERHFLSPAAFCDCGTVLARGADTEPKKDPKEKLDREIARLARKGWSDAKIERLLEDKEKATARPSRFTPPDSLELWAGILSDLASQKGATSVGYLVHFYSGDTTTEQFPVSRRDTGLDKVLDSLGRTPEDTLMMAAL